MWPMSNEIVKFVSVYWKQITQKLYTEIKVEGVRERENEDVDACRRTL